MNKLGRAVDAALREMVAGDGPPDLRQRVLARIDEPARRPAPTWLVLAAAAGIAVAVASVALLRTPEREGVTPSVRPPARALPVAPPAGAPVAAASTHVPTAPSAPAPFRPGRRAPRRGEAPPLGESVVDVEVEPIELSPLDVVPMSGEPIAVTALRIERMQIEPLAEPQP